MASYHITVNEKMALGRNLIALLQSVPQAVTFSVPDKTDKSAIKETQYLMSSPEMVRRLKEAEKEMNEDKGITISVEDLWK